MNILDCAYAMARNAGYLNVECLGVKDGLLIFNLISVPTDTPPSIVGYPEFLVGTNRDDLHFVQGPECLAYFDLFEEDTQSDDFQMFREELRTCEQEGSLDDDFPLSSIEDEEISDEEGFLLSADSFMRGDYTNWHFDPVWIAWQTVRAIDRFAPLLHEVRVVDKLSEDDGTQLTETTTNEEDGRNGLSSRRARTLSHLLSIVTRRLFEDSRAYLAYGPYWPAVKRILIKEGRFTGTAIEPVLADIYKGEEDLETLIAAELFRTSSLKRNPLGETSWCLSSNHGHVWRLIDREMETGIVNVRALLGLTTSDLYETPEEAVAYQSPDWRTAKDVRFYGFWRGLPVWVFIDEGKISCHEVVYGETPDTMKRALLDQAKRILSEATLTNYELSGLELREDVGLIYNKQ